LVRPFDSFDIIAPLLWLRPANAAETVDLYHFVAHCDNWFAKGQNESEFSAKIAYEPV
jgi:hypothetical protein